MTAQADECETMTSSPLSTAQMQLPLPMSPIKVLTPTKASIEPLQLSPWCNQTRPTHPPSPPPFRRRSTYKPRAIITTPSPAKPHQRRWRSNSEGSATRDAESPSKSTLNPSASEFVPKTFKPKPVHNPLGGKLVLVAAGFFERAYGLNGQPRVDHTALKEEMMTLTGCSERAVQAVLYGSSYNDLLEGLRAKVPGYTVQKDMSQDFSLLPFYNYDGNVSTSEQLPTSSDKSATTKYSAIALLALAAFTAVLC